MRVRAVSHCPLAARGVDPWARGGDGETLGCVGRRWLVREVQRAAPNAQWLAEPRRSTEPGRPPSAPR